MKDTFGFFDIQRIFGQFESVKRSGIRVTLILSVLLIFLSIASVAMNLIRHGINANGQIRK